MIRKNIREIVDNELSFMEKDTDEGLKKLEKKLEKEKIIGKNNFWHISNFIAAAAILFAIILTSAVSVYAYQYYQGKYKLPKFKQTFFSDETNKRNEIIGAGEIVIGSMDNLLLKWTGWEKGQEGEVITFTLMTKDGTPLIQDAENMAPVFFPISFETLQITANNETVQFSGIHKPYEMLSDNYYLGCTSIAQDYSSADFELSIGDEFANLQGEKITIQLSNLVGTYHVFTDLKTNGTLGDILSDAVEGDNLHIVFSEEYPECYIDSFGFVNDNKFENPKQILHIVPYGKKMFTMTVVCDDKSRDVIQKLVFQNKNTGLNGTAETEVKELSDGRLRFFYSVNYDGSYTDEKEPRDTTFEDLQQLVLKLDGDYVTQTLLEGTLEEIIILDK